MRSTRPALLPPQAATRVTRRRLFTKYVVVLVTLVSGAVLMSGLVELYFSYRENKAALVAIEREKALQAATRIGGFVEEIERQVAWTILPRFGPEAGAMEQRRFDYLRLLRQVPAITEVSYIDGAGHEELRVSRLAMDVVGGGADVSAEPRFVKAKADRLYLGPVYFRKGSEPYMTVALAGTAGDSGVTAAEVNLKFILDVVSQIKVGKAGHAYVVDANGTLLAHPDISLVLQKTSLATLPQVHAAIAGREMDDVAVAWDLRRQAVLTAYAPIAPLRWFVFVEQPIAEAFQPLQATMERTALLILLGIALSVVASVVLAKKMVTPIRTLEGGAARIGAGALDHRIEVHTGDELEALGARFNSMAEQLQESYAGLERKVEERTRELTEALEQQTATAEVLRAISSSPTDVQPVLDTVAERAARLCDALNAGILLVDDGHLRVVAHHGAMSGIWKTGEGLPLDRKSVSGRAVIDRETVHVDDLLAVPDEFPRGHDLATRFGHRTTLATPLLREGVALGAILIRRAEPRPFSPKQLALIKTFADQAVIAIENVRLFKELEEKNHALTETLEQQTATAEILRVISSSPTDLTPVMDAVVQNAARLCDAADCQLQLIEGDLLREVASFGMMPVADATRRGIPIRGDFVTGRAVLQRTTVHVHDLAAELAEFPAAAPLQQATGVRSALATPLIRKGVPVGAILIRRTEVRPFSPKQVALLQTFADQAVIAIENVRLFTELQEKNRAITDALERQTATAEILRVISASPTDVQPVFDAIARSASRLCGGLWAIVTRFDGERLHLAAQHSAHGDAEQVRRGFPMHLTRGVTSARSILDRQIVHIPDAALDPELDQRIVAAAGSSSFLAVPMFREGEPIGAIGVSKAAAGPFTETQIALLQTFADQAVIAIENVRLFTALEEKNRAVTEALEQQTATAEILRVISSSPTDVQPVFDAIVASAMRLVGGSSASLTRVAGDELHLAALTSTSDTGDEQLRSLFPRPIDRSSLAARAILDGRPFILADVETDQRVTEEIRAVMRARGTRSMIWVPMIKEGQRIGVIGVSRPHPGDFARAQIALLETFADQAVIAIENVRLFTELEERTRALSRSVEELRALGEVGQAVSSTLDVETVLDTIVSRASDLARTDGGAIYEYDQATEEFHLRATQNFDAQAVEILRARPIRKGEGVLGRVAATLRPYQVPDILADNAYQSRVREVLTSSGARALLAVPLVSEDTVIGGLVVHRSAPGEFSSEVIDLLTTFATQSALAIQNARLFREIDEKSRQLEIANRHKSEFLANMSHELRTPLNAIIGFSEVLLERMFGELNDKQAEYLDDILSSGRHLLSLINDILDLSKVEAGRMELELTSFDLPQAVENAVALVKGRAAAHAIRMEVDVDERLGPFTGDERKFKQILLNLLSNAVKFTPDGGRVSVSAVQLDGSVEITVRDSGIGIAPEDQATIFEEFRQTASGRGQREGTGLGLALTKRFVELHGGTIRVESAVGDGASFTVTLPVRPWPTS